MHKHLSGSYAPAMGMLVPPPFQKNQSSFMRACQPDVPGFYRAIFSCRLLQHLPFILNYGQIEREINIQLSRSIEAVHL